MEIPRKTRSQNKSQNRVKCEILGIFIITKREFLLNKMFFVCVVCNLPLQMLKTYIEIKFWNVVPKFCKKYCKKFTSSRKLFLLIIQFSTFHRCNIFFLLSFSFVASFFSLYFLCESRFDLVILPCCICNCIERGNLFLRTT